MSCPDQETLDVIIDGFTDCGCFPISVGHTAKLLSFTGIIGAYTVTRTVGPGSPSFWQNLSIGTVTYQIYDGPGCILGGSPLSHDVNIVVSCPGNDGKTFNAIIGSGEPAGGSTFFGGDGDADEAMANTLSCGGTLGIVGTVTVSL